jgi:hypothetical protein
MSAGTNNSKKRNCQSLIKIHDCTSFKNSAKNLYLWEKLKGISNYISRYYGKTLQRTGNGKKMV